MKTAIKITVRAYHVDIRDMRTGEVQKDTIVVTKEMLQSAALLGMTDEDIIYRLYNRQGYRVLSIDKPVKAELPVDLYELYHDPAKN